MTFPITNRIIGIRDIDKGIKDWFSVTVAPTVESENGTQVVSVVMAAGERWVTSADRKGIRDKDGRLILPVIQIRRTSIGTTENMTALGANTPTLKIATLVSEKQSQLENLDYSRPLSSRRLNGSSVYDIYTVPFPIKSTLNYEIKIQAQYQRHMNSIIQKIMSSMQFADVPSFVIDLSTNSSKTPIKTGQGSVEIEKNVNAEYASRNKLADYFVVGFLDSDISSGDNSNEFTDQERIVETEFKIKVPSAFMLDENGSQPAVQKQTTAFGIFLGDEEVVVVDNRDDLDKIFGKLK